MNIYIAHSRSFDFTTELYQPIKDSLLSKEHRFIFPHDEDGEPISSKELFQKGWDLVIAEVSYAATGLGIELGWADMLHVPIVCLYKKGSVISDSLKNVTDKFYEYDGETDLINKIALAITDLT